MINATAVTNPGEAQARPGSRLGLAPCHRILLSGATETGFAEELNSLGSISMDVERTFPWILDTSPDQGLSAWLHFQPRPAFYTKALASDAMLGHIS